MRNVTNLSRRDVDRALAVVAEAATGHNGLPFDLPVLVELAQLIPVDRQVAYCEFAFSTHTCSVLVEYPTIELAPGTEETVHATCDSYPLREIAVGGSELPLKLSDFLSPRQLHSNQFYVDVLRPNGFEHELKLFLPAPAGISRGFAFVRGPGPDFSERDRTILALLRPHLAKLRRRWEERVRPGSLTPREAEVVRFVAAGLTNREIAERLVLSTGTVRSHLDHVYEKLGVHTRTAAVAALTGTPLPG